MKELDYNNCDRENIRQVGAIQPHGFFLAFRANDQTVYHCGENIHRWLGKNPDDVLGAKLGDLLPGFHVQEILRETQQMDPEDARFFTLPELGQGKGWLDIYTYSWGGLVAVEIERYPEAYKIEAEEVARSHRRSQVLVEDLHGAKNLEEAAKLVCRAVRSMIGYDRVMMYRYLPNWDGEVIAEDKGAEAHSFLQHRFPATDIRLPARQLYLDNRSRQISSSSEQAVPIRPQTHYLTARPLDLTASKLRAVSPIHLEYLRNMGVSGSFSVAVVVDQKLWGLIACHANVPTAIPHEIRLSCETAGSTFAILASLMERSAAQSKQILFDMQVKELLSRVGNSPEIVDTFFREHERVQNIFRATGMALLTKSSVRLAGLTPPDFALRKLAADLKPSAAASDGTVAIDCLKCVKPEWESLREIACGVLAVFSPRNEDGVLMFFRPEALRSIIWGGDPRKTMEKRKYQGHINPRESFESWSETIGGHAVPWIDHELTGARFINDILFDNILIKQRQLGEFASK